VALENAGFLKRLYEEMYSREDFLAATEDK